MTLNEQIKWCKLQIKAGYEVVAIRSILTRLKSLEKPQAPPHEYHNQSVQAYKNFLEGNGLPPVVDVRQGKALKELLPKLQTLTSSRSPEGAYHAIQYIFNGWERLNQYHKKKKTLTHINDNLVEILDQIRYGATKKQTNVDEAQQLANAIKGKYQRSD
jgi:hypothetical protein